MRVPRPPGARALAVLILALAASAQGCGRPSSPFSTANARAHVNRLAGAIGPRPAGSDANRRAREYLVEQLRFYGFTVRVQEADGVRPEEGLTAHVQNIIAIVPGSLPDAIGLVAHYDSVSGAPGAGDDAAGVAVCLEVGRLLAARRAPRHSVMVLLTDAEEDGLLGAAALVTDPEVKARLRAYINIDSAGNAAPAMIFQTGPGNGWLVRASGAAPQPRGSSMAYEIYSRLPNDTDFTVLSALGAPGLNMGAVGDSYAYHTPQDGPERLTDEVLEQAGANILAVVQALEDRNLATRTPEQPVFFDLLSTRLVVISPLAALWLGVLALAIGTAGWLRATMTALAELWAGRLAPDRSVDRRRRDGGRRRGRRGSRPPAGRARGVPPVVRALRDGSGSSSCSPGAPRCTRCWPSTRGSRRRCEGSAIPRSRGP